MICKKWWNKSESKRIWDEGKIRMAQTTSANVIEFLITVVASSVDCSGTRFLTLRNIDRVWKSAFNGTQLSVQSNNEPDQFIAKCCTAGRRDARNTCQSSMIIHHNYKINHRKFRLNIKVKCECTKNKKSQLIAFRKKVNQLVWQLILALAAQRCHVRFSWVD